MRKEMQSSDKSCRENAKLRPHPQLSSPGSTGRSSTPRPLGSITAVSGILDHPPSRVMTPRLLIVIEDHPQRRPGAGRDDTGIGQRATHSPHLISASTSFRNASREPSRE
ncbi:hypothetical protein XH93_26830 [Bradyrhizobium sp. CCBAU 51753]|nr:hypothetical protein XH93_26830 [Bradyrhizobium sp. CCBAU 51753]